MWSKNTKFIMAVLEDPLTDSHIIDEILSDPDEIGMYYMWRAAEHGNLSYKSALRLIKSPNYVIRESLSRNPNIGKDLLEKLSNDPVYVVRQSAVKNPNATEIMRRKFLMSDRKMTLEALAQAHSPA